MLQQQKLVCEVLWAVLVAMTRGVNTVERFSCVDHEGFHHRATKLLFCSSWRPLWSKRPTVKLPFVLATRTAHYTLQTRMKVHIGKSAHTHASYISPFVVAVDMLHLIQRPPSIIAWLVNYTGQCMQCSCIISYTAHSYSYCNYSAIKCNACTYTV